ncbi:MAG: ATP-binding protein [Azonexus sp.]
MKHHFVRTENYKRLLDGVAFMEGRGSLTTPLCLLHGEPAVGKTRNVSKVGPDMPAVFIRGHVGMNLDGLIWSVSQGLGIKHCSNRSAEMAQQIAALQRDGTKLIFDEAQFGLSMKHAGKPAAGIEYLRHIAESGNTYAILICHQSEVAGFSESKHIRTRIGHRIEMFDATPADTAAFVHELCEVAVDDEVPAIVHKQTHGKVRLIENAIATLEQIARMKGVTRLVGADVAKTRLVVDHEEGLVPKAAKPAKGSVK